jgi:Beta-lactamase enzyme family
VNSLVPVTPAGQHMQPTKTNASGFRPTLVLSSTPALWYTDPLTGTLSGGEYELNLWTNHPGKPSPVMAQLLTANADGSQQQEIATSSLIDVNSSGTGNHQTHLMLHVLAPLTLGDQRLVIAISYAGGPGDAAPTMVYNGGVDFDTNFQVAAGCYAFGSETARVSALLRTGSDGTQGFLLRTVGGAVLAEQNQSFQYDPASSIKIVVGVGIMKLVDSGSVSLSGTTTPYYAQGLQGSCPEDTGTPEALSLGTLLEDMLENSDNIATRSLIDFLGGLSAVNSTAVSIGMTSTNVNIYPGCGITNKLTQADAATLYGALANGRLLSTTSRAALYARMPADAGDFSDTLSAAKAIVSQVAPTYGLTTAQTTAFLTALDVHYKAGDDVWCTPNCLYYYAVAGDAVIPACSGPNQTSVQYSWGLFIDGGSNQTNTVTTFFDNQAEPLREPIESALAGWSICSP